MTTVESRNPPWQVDKVAYTYINQLRTQLSLTQPIAASWVEDYTYDAGRRLKTLSTDAGVYAYDYYVGTNEIHETRTIQKLAFANGLYITNQYDAFGELL